MFSETVEQGKNLCYNKKSNLRKIVKNIKNNNNLRKDNTKY